MVVIEVQMVVVDSATVTFLFHGYKLGYKFIDACINCGNFVQVICYLLRKGGRSLLCLCFDTSKKILTHALSMRAVPALSVFCVEVAELLPFSMYRAFFSDPTEVCYPVAEIF